MAVVQPARAKDTAMRATGRLQVGHHLPPLVFRPTEEAYAGSEGMHLGLTGHQSPAVLWL